MIAADQRTSSPTAGETSIPISRRRVFAWLQAPIPESISMDPESIQRGERTLAIEWFGPLGLQPQLTRYYLIADADLRQAQLKEIARTLHRVFNLPEVAGTEYHWADLDAQLYDRLETPGPTAEPLKNNLWEGLRTLADTKKWAEISVPVEGREGPFHCIDTASTQYKLLANQFLLGVTHRSTHLGTGSAFSNLLLAIGVAHGLYQQPKIVAEQLLKDLSGERAKFVSSVETKPDILTFEHVENLAHIPDVFLKALQLEADTPDAVKNFFAQLELIERFETVLTRFGWSALLGRHWATAQTSFKVCRAIACAQVERLRLLKAHPSAQVFLSPHKLAHPASTALSYTPADLLETALGRVLDDAQSRVRQHTDRVNTRITRTNNAVALMVGAGGFIETPHRLVLASFVEQIERNFKAHRPLSVNPVAACVARAKQQIKTMISDVCRAADWLELTMDLTQLSRMVKGTGLEGEVASLSEQIAEVKANQQDAQDQFKAIADQLQKDSDTTLDGYAEQFTKFAVWLETQRELTLQSTEQLAQQVTTPEIESLRLDWDSLSQAIDTLPLDVVCASYARLRLQTLRLLGGRAPEAMETPQDVMAPELAQSMQTVLSSNQAAVSSMKEVVKAQVTHVPATLATVKEGVAIKQNAVNDDLAKLSAKIGTVKNMVRGSALLGLAPYVMTLLDVLGVDAGVATELMAIEGVGPAMIAVSIVTLVLVTVGFAYYQSLENEHKKQSLKLPQLYCSPHSSGSSTPISEGDALAVPVGVRQGVGSASSNSRPVPAY